MLAFDSGSRPSLAGSRVSGPCNGDPTQVSESSVCCLLQYDTVNVLPFEQTWLSLGYRTPFANCRFLRSYLELPNSLNIRSNRSRNITTPSAPLDLNEQTIFKVRAQSYNYSDNELVPRGHTCRRVQLSQIQPRGVTTTASVCLHHLQDPLDGEW